MPQSLGGDQLCAMQFFNPNSGPQKHPTQPGTFSTLGVFFFNSTLVPPLCWVQNLVPKNTPPNRQLFQPWVFFFNRDTCPSPYWVEILPAGVIFFLPSPCSTLPHATSKRRAFPRATLRPPMYNPSPLAHEKVESVRGRVHFGSRTYRIPRLSTIG